MYLEYIAWCTDRGKTNFESSKEFFSYNINLTGFEHVSYNYFHSRRCIEGIGIKKSDIFSNPTLIELSTIQKQIDDLTSSKQGLCIFIFSNFLFI